MSKREKWFTAVRRLLSFVLVGGGYSFCVWCCARSGLGGEALGALGILAVPFAFMMLDEAYFWAKEAMKNA